MVCNCAEAPVSIRSTVRFDTPGLLGHLRLGQLTIKPMALNPHAYLDENCLVC